MLKLLAPLASLLLPMLAFAADDTADQALLLAPPQSVASDVSADAPAPHRFSLGLGTGVDAFGGNMGKLYSKSTPVAEIRGEAALSRLFTARAGASLAKFSFSAEPNGAVDVSANSVQAAAQLHYLGTALAGGGFDPYLSAGAAHYFRSQTFRDHNSVEKDNAFAVSAGLGTNYVPANSKIGVWLEADASQIYFQDRFDQQYLASGIEDMTGLLYSARVGLKYLF
jgi:hypothetical protein